MAKVTAGGTLLPVGVCGVGAGGGAVGAAFTVDGLGVAAGLSPAFPVEGHPWSWKQQDRDHSQST